MAQVTIYKKVFDRLSSQCEEASGTTLKVETLDLAIILSRNQELEMQVSELEKCAIDIRNGIKEVLGIINLSTDF